MANNLSGLISDAFTIYSEAYSKIGTMGVRVVDLDKSPLQPKLWAELVYATRLYRVISPSIVLNDDGDAIIAVYGDISTMNNLLLKLKRAVRLYDSPVFPTPLTEFVFNLADTGGADADATYLTVVTEGNLPNSRRPIAGTGMSITDNGPQGTFVFNNTAAVDSVQVNTAINPVLDINGQIERFFYGSVAITGTRTWSLTNTTNARRLQATFVISGLTPGDSTHDQTLWANTTIFTISGETPSPGVFRPGQDGRYEIIATTYDGVNWVVRIF